MLPFWHFYAFMGPTLYLAFKNAKEKAPIFSVAYTRAWAQALLN